MTAEEIAAELREWGKALGSPLIRKRLEELADMVEQLKERPKARKR